jgi:hypothetical protein
METSGKKLPPAFARDAVAVITGAPSRLRDQVTGRFGPVSVL